MHPSDSDNQRPTQVDPDGGRDSKQPSIQDSIRLVLEEILNVANRSVRIAEPGKPCNLGASVSGKGKMVA